MAKRRAALRSGAGLARLATWHRVLRSRRSLPHSAATPSRSAPDHLCTAVPLLGPSTRSQQLSKPDLASTARGPARLPVTKQPRRHAAAAQRTQWASGSARAGRPGGEARAQAAERRQQRAPLLRHDREACTAAALSLPHHTTPHHLTVMPASVRPWRVVLGPHAAPGGRAATAAARSRAARSSGVVGAASATAGSGDSGSDSRQPGGRGSSSGRSGGGRASSADGRGRGSSASGGRGRGQSGGRGRGHSGGTGSGGPSVGRSSGGGAPDPPLLTAWIKNTDQLPVEQRLPSLQQLVERHAASFNFIHTAAAITQLGQ